MDFVCSCTKICKPMFVEPVLITKSVVWLIRNVIKFIKLRRLVNCSQ